MGATSRTGGWATAESFAKCRSVPNGVTCAARSVTATSSPPTSTLSIPNAGRACERPQSDTISAVAAVRRTSGSSDRLRGRWGIASAMTDDASRKGAMRSDCA